MLDASTPPVMTQPTGGVNFADFKRSNLDDFTLVEETQSQMEPPSMIGWQEVLERKRARSPGTSPFRSMLRKRALQKAPRAPKKGYGALPVVRSDVVAVVATAAAAEPARAPVVENWYDRPKTPAAADKELSKDFVTPTAGQFRLGRGGGKKVPDTAFDAPAKTPLGSRFGKGAAAKTHASKPEAAPEKPEAPEHPEAIQTAERTEPFPSPPPAKRAKRAKAAKAAKTAEAAAAAAKTAAAAAAEKTAEAERAAKDAAAEKAHADGVRWADIDAEPVVEDDSYGEEGGFGLPADEPTIRTTDDPVAMIAAVDEKIPPRSLSRSPSPARRTKAAKKPAAAVAAVDEEAALFAAAETYAAEDLPTLRKMGKSDPRSARIAVIVEARLVRERPPRLKKKTAAAEAAKKKTAAAEAAKREDLVEEARRRGRRRAEEEDQGAAPLIPVPPPPHLHPAPPRTGTSPPCACPPPTTATSLTSPTVRPHPKTTKRSVSFPLAKVAPCRPGRKSGRKSAGGSTGSKERRAEGVHAQVRSAGFGFPDCADDDVTRRRARTRQSNRRQGQGGHRRRVRRDARAEA